MSHICLIFQSAFNHAVTEARMSIGVVDVAKHAFLSENMLSNKTRIWNGIIGYAPTLDS